MAGSVSLSEQFGAMAVIEALQHQALKVQDHLNLPARREEAAANIRRYYEAQGVEVDDALIERGVHDYFDRRLTFVEAQRSTRVEKLAQWYVQREQWIVPLKRKAKVLGVALGAVLVGMVGYTTLQPVYQSYLQESRVAFIMEQRQAYAQQEAAAGQLRQDLVRLASEAETAGIPLGHHVASLSAERLGASLASYSEARHAAWPEGKVPTPYAELEQRFSQVVVAQKQLVAASDAAKAVKQQMQSLLAAYQRLNLVKAAPEFKAAIKQFDRLNSAWQNVVSRLSLRQGEAQSLAAAVAAIQTTLDQYAAIEQLATISQSAQDLAKSFAAMRLDQAGEAVVIAAVATVESAAEAMNLKAAQAGLGALQQLHAYAKTEVTFKITNRSGVKSGVERTYNAGGGKAWYLIVDAEDAAGGRVPVPIEDSEKGAQVFAATFGVEVPEAEYQRVKAEKTKSGHIRDRLLGNKPKDSLSIKYVDRVRKNPNLISSW